jgi:NAD dependent epimerase/dehydratase family enzyme
MTIIIQPRWSLGRGKTLVPSRWQATAQALQAIAVHQEGVHSHTCAVGAGSACDATARANSAHRQV